jgi:hypothetical protein
MKIGISNPLTTEQVALLDLKKQVRTALPYSTIEVKEVVERNDYTTCAVQIHYIDEGDQFKTSVCLGRVLSRGTYLQRVTKAEIVAITMCLSELDIDVEFDGDPMSLPDDEIKVAETAIFDRKAVLHCRDIAEVRYLCGIYGIDQTPLDVKAKELRSSKKRLTVTACADVFFPRGTAPKLVHVQKQESGVKIKEQKRAETGQRKSGQAMPKGERPLRSGVETNSILLQLGELGITAQYVRDNTKYPTLLKFAGYATDTEIDELIRKYEEDTTQA